MQVNDLEVDKIVQSVGIRFRCFGGGQKSDSNPFANALSDGPLCFAATVDVEQVVRHVIDLLQRRLPHD